MLARIEITQASVCQNKQTAKPPPPPRLLKLRRPTNSPPARQPQSYTANCRDLVVLSTAPIHAKMARPNFPLPRELRDQIYGYLLDSA
jgi:hypothetical protein